VVGLDELTIEINSIGTKRWIKNGRKHRTDGPAIEFANGYKAWYQNDKCHRTDGPAVEYADGTEDWFLDGKKLTKFQLNSKTFMVITKLI
jgi:hypothetical protein